MDKALARAYHNKLSALFEELLDTKTPEQRFPLVVRIQGLIGPMYEVNSAAAQHVEEALRKLKYADIAVVNAALATINTSLRSIDETILTHGSNHFLQHGTEERLFAKPVAELELRSLAERGRIFDDMHSPFVRAIAIEPHIERTFLKASASDLRPVLSRMGFPHTEALLFFTTNAKPQSAAPAGNIPSLMLHELRSGSPVRVVKHRILR